MPRPDWIAKYSSQVVLLVNNLIWCNKIERTFEELHSDGKAMKTYIGSWNEGLRDLIKMV